MFFTAGVGRNSNVQVHAFCISVFDFGGPRVRDKQRAARSHLVTGAASARPRLRRSGRQSGIGEPPIVTGFPPGVVSGTIHITDGPAADAQADSTAMFGELDQACDVSYPAVQDLVPEPVPFGFWRANCRSGSSLRCRRSPEDRRD
jgi:hypothetical protein